MLNNISVNDIFVVDGSDGLFLFIVRFNPLLYLRFLIDKGGLQLIDTRLDLVDIGGVFPNGTFHFEGDFALASIDGFLLLLLIF